MVNEGTMFSDRIDAGWQLADRLRAMKLARPLVFALPRGGVPVAVEIARTLGAPLDLVLVRKIGAPGNPELALGAIVEGHDTQIVINEDIQRMSGAGMDYLERAYVEQLAELERRRKRYVGDRPRLDPKGRTVVVVDDGLATGATMKAAVSALSRAEASRIVVALPVAPAQTLTELRAQADDFVCLIPSTAFRGVGGFYRDFHQLSDEETIAMLEDHWAVQTSDVPTRKASAGNRRRVKIPPLGLIGDLVVPAKPRGLVLFAPGSGSSRRSPRNMSVAAQLGEKGFATLLFDLLTPDEDADRQNAFDIPRLAERVVEACLWAASEPDLADLPLGLFGASTGAAAALVAAAEIKGRVAAIVSRGGRPDLAGNHLAQVTAPTLLIVGGLDHQVIGLNEHALEALRCPKELKIVPGAGHLFEEPGTLDLAIGYAANWLEQHFAPLTATVPHPAISSTPSEIAGLRAAAVPLPATNDPDFVKAFDRYGSSRIVLLGEATHGTSEFYRARAAITRRLIEKHGFRGVALEADWPDVAAIDRQIRHGRHPANRPKPFARFPTWMWRNTEFADFTGDLRGHNASVNPVDHVRLFGLDLYNMNASIGAVVDYLDGVDRPAAEVARRRYGCLSPWSREPAAYGRAALSHGFAICQEPVTGILVDLLMKELDYAQRDGDQFFDATQNARLVANAERYYRAMYYGSHASWNLRDTHMFETLKHVLDHLGPDGKVVVWAHNSHIGDARFTDMGRERGEVSIGQLCREAFGEEVALIGFGTATGTVAAASEWDAPMEIKTLRAPRLGSVEALCNSVDLERFLFDFRRDHDETARQSLALQRLQRYVGVIYRPESERASHYGHASLSRQYDGFVWFDRTDAVTSLPTLVSAVEDDTFPFGL